MMSPSTTKLNPILLWGQSRSQIFLTITCQGATDAPTCQITKSRDNGSSGDSLWIEGSKHALSLSLFSKVSQSCSPKTLNDGVTSIVLQKDVQQVWPRLTESSQKFHFIRIDWSKWVDDDGEGDCSSVEPQYNDDNISSIINHPPPLIPFGDDSSTSIPIEPVDCRDLSSDWVPSISDAPHMFEEYWQNRLTMAQRLHTLTSMWNAIPQQQRPVREDQCDP